MDYLYGRLYKETVIQNYKGIQSATAKVLIDNAHRTIQVDVTPDEAMSDTSTNTVQNKVIKKYIDDLFAEIQNK